MKALIWIACIIGASIVQILLKEIGIGGAIPAMLVYGSMLGCAQALCKKHDERKSRKAAKNAAHNNVNNTPATHGQESVTPSKEAYHMKCNKCGYIIPDDSDFCQFCGVRLDLQPEKPSAAPEIMDENESVDTETEPVLSAEDVTASQRYFDSDYGYSPENPIVTSSVPMVGYYLYSLRNEEGRSFTWERQPRKYGAMIDEYQLFVGGTPDKTIFFNPHGKDCDYVPAGLTRNQDAFLAAQQGMSLEEYQAALVAKEQRRKKAVRRIVSIAVILVLIAASIPLSKMLIIPGLKFLQAKKQFNSGDYSGAYSAFCELGSFASAEDWAKESLYQQAVELRNAGSYASANTLFKDLGNYRDSKDLIHEHAYTLSTVIEATCTKGGTETFVCSCGDSKEEHTKETGHKHEAISTTPPTCTTDGQNVLRCVYCGDEKTEAIKQKGHSYQAKITKTATCTSTGTKTYTCTDCNDTYKENIAKTDHTYSAATCTTAKKCKTCGQTSGSALGHSTDSAQCSRCGVVLFKTLTYSGTGSSVIKNVIAPKGNFIISGVATSTNGRAGNFDVTLSSGGSGYSTIAYWYDGVYSSKQRIEKAETFSGPINGGILEIDADDNVKWTITIEVR